MIKAVVLFSGGQDSTAMLVAGIREWEWDEVHALTVDYGQRHDKELGQAKRICGLLAVPLTVVDFRSIGKHLESTLTGQGGSVSSLLPSTYVPNRNALLLSVAHAVAQRLGFNAVAIGANSADPVHYPDCSQVFLNSLQLALNLGADTDIRILAPLMTKSKAEIFQLAADAGVLDLVLEESRTCYNNLERRFPWGYGCGECDSCRLREDGWNVFISGGQEPSKPARV